MKKINWFPEYWSLIEKVKLLDFWRYRYSKNLLNYSPNKEPYFGGLGFFDASYEYMKYSDKREEKYKKVREEFYIRKTLLENELQVSQKEDHKRLILLINAEQKAFEYWEEKMLFKAIEDDIPEILKSAIWLIDERERVFKEAFSYLIEYDRKYLSPLTFPERELGTHPLTLSECYYWLTRNYRTLKDNPKDEALFLKFRSKIKPIEFQLDLLDHEYIPNLLSMRHQMAINVEQKRNFSRTKNGDLIRDDEVINIFERPEFVYKPDTEVVLQELVKDFKDRKLEHIEYKSSGADQLLIFEQEEQVKDQTLPEDNPYVILHQDLFNIFKTGSKEETDNLVQSLKEFVQKRKLVHKNKMYFILGSLKELKEKRFKTKTPKVKAKDPIEKENMYIFNGENLIEDIDDDIFMPDYEDYFDDKTRFKIFIKDKYGYKFNRKNMLKHVLQGKFLLNQKALTLKEKLLNFKKDLMKTFTKNYEMKIDLNLAKEEDLKFNQHLDQLKEKDVKIEKSLPKYKM